MNAWTRPAVALLAGLVIGVALGRWTEHRRDGRRGKDSGRMVERLASDLSLSAEQKQKVAKVFESKKAGLDAARADSRKKMKALRESTRADIRRVLTPEQRTKFDAKWEERRARRAAKRR